MFKKAKTSMAVRFTLLAFLSLLFSSLIILFVFFVGVWLGFKIPTAKLSLFIILAFSVSCVLGTIFAGLFSRSMSKDYERLKKIINEVANGNFDVVFPEAEDDPYGQIGKDLNTMVTELKSVQILRTDFVSNFSHELKTPITSINGFAELLDQNDITDDERHEYARIIYDESSRLLTLAKNTLLLSKLEGQSVLKDKSLFKMDKVIEDSLIMLSADVEKKNINITAELDKAEYYWDESLVSQAVTNVISNAVKYTGKNGHIHVKLVNKNGEMTLTVADNGIGMDKETASHVFERYYQGDHSRKSEGNGLGLAIVAKIMFLCGGSISVESEPNKGSVFTLTFPEKNRYVPSVE